YNIFVSIFVKFPRNRKGFKSIPVELGFLNFREFCTHVLYEVAVGVHTNHWEIDSRRQSVVPICLPLLDKRHDHSCLDIIVPIKNKPCLTYAYPSCGANKDIGGICWICPASITPPLLSVSTLPPLRFEIILSDVH